MIKKYALLGVNTESEVNIGDYIQALASRQFIPQVDQIIQREKLKDYGGEPIRMIMNGWYMHNPKQWPPSNQIDPLFVAFHINILAEKEMMTEDGIKYLKKWQPIGCRDKRTVEILKSHGIDAYFSGCMTLTLGEKYKSTEKDGSVYFVDATCSLPKHQVPRVLLFLIKNKKKVSLLVRKKYSDNNNLSLINKLKRYIHTAQFLKAYSKIFDINTILNATFICQQSVEIAQTYNTEKKLFEYAENLIHNYAKANFVVTSRIHCALPCLGIGTPVIYTEVKNDSIASTCRLGGLKDLFTILQWDGNKLIPLFNLKGKIQSNRDFPKNKDDYKLLSERLKKTCINWNNRL